MTFPNGKLLLLVICLPAFVYAASLNAHDNWKWEAVATGWDSSLRGLSALSGGTLWASGSGGMLLRSTDGGRTWQRSRLDELASKLDFRDIEAFDSKRALAMSSGTGELSTVYRTEDGGTHWKLVFTNPDRDGFFDAMKFWNAKDGVLIGDPVRGRFAIFRTHDGGLTWTPIQGPEALPGESLFAASGTSLVLGKQSGEAWFGTGGGTSARAFHCTKEMRSCTASATRLKAAAPSAGIFSMAACGPQSMIVVGGDFKQPDSQDSVSAYSRDAGETWSPGSGLGGYRSAVAYLDANDCNRAIAVGTNGSDVTEDGGAHWRSFSDAGFSVLASAGRQLWAAGPHGRVARLIR